MFLSSYLNNDIDINYLKHNEMFCHQGLMMLHKWLLAYGEITDNFDLNLKEKDYINVIYLNFMLADHLPQGEVEHNKIGFSYAIQYHSLHKIPKYEIARAYDVFINNYDLSLELYYNEFQKKYDLTVKDYFYNTYSLLNLVFKTENFFKSQVVMQTEKFDAKGLKNSHKKYYSGMSINLKSAKEKALSSIKDAWDYEFMFINPILKIDNDLFLPFNLSTILYQFFDGFYWKLRYCLKKENTNFFSIFGKPFEKYISNIAEASTEISKNYSYIKERVFNIGKQEERTSDGYIYKDNNLLIIECKAKAPKSLIIKGYDLETIYSETINMIVAPSRQVDECYNKLIINDDEFITLDKKIANIYILIVSMDKIQPIPPIYKYAKHFLYEYNCLIPNENVEVYSQLISKKIKACINFSAYDFEKLCGLLENDKDIFSLLDKYISEAERPFENFIADNKLEEIRSSFIEKNLQKNCEEIYNKIFDKE